ncbi:MAG: penicillin-binding protein activator LpoB [Serratia symbiotica]|nr:penicillin-binding protein activator LpoB [Serratia symbiotica]
MKKYLLVALAALTLSGCLSRLPLPNTVESVTLPDTKKQPQQSACEEVPQPPKIQQLDWLRSLQPLVNQMLEAKGVTAGSILLVDTIKNNTNGVLQTSKATSALYTALMSNSTFSVLPEARLTSARQGLGLSSEDSFSSRSKAIGLARIVNAKYLLYSVFSGDAKSPTLDMQLMLVQTGEIIWSGNDTVEP